jgi:O-antigen biosynthesis protein
MSGPSGADAEVAAAWLSRSLLLVVGCPDVNPGDARATLSAGDNSFDVELRCIALGHTNGSPERTILTAAVADDSSAARTAEKLSIRPAGDEAGATELTLTDLGNLHSDRLAGLDDDSARRVLEFISAAPTAHGVSEQHSLALSNTLHNLRNRLRERLPAVVLEGDQPLCGNVDALVPIDDSTFFVGGWMRDGEAPIIRLTAITSEGECVELLGQVLRLDLQEFEMFSGGPYRDTVDSARFFACFETTRPSRLRKSWVFELQNETGRAVEMYAMPNVADVPSALTTILRSIPESVLPAIQRLQERARASVEIESVADYGDPPESPQISIVVPLYERIDLVEHQLLQFNRDPEIQAQELIYVLDSPELGTELADRARQFARLYRVPFRVVTMEENSGFGAATDSGVSVARGRLVLLLNSDVLPAAPGWLGTMQAFYDATPDIGALGAKLLYEDDSLQHAGLYFDRVLEGPTAGSWANMHYFKGLHKDLPAANVARPVPAVTAACLLIDRDLYYRVGGMPDVYVQGDYEDSEMCIKLLQEGRENWYLPAAELYHLEGSSYSAAERGITGSYNRWLQTARWGQAIEAAVARYPRT